MEQVGVSVIEGSQPKGSKAEMGERKLRNWQGVLKETGGKIKGQVYLKYNSRKTRAQKMFVYGQNDINKQFRTVNTEKL